MILAPATHRACRCRSRFGHAAVLRGQMRHHPAIGHPFPVVLPRRRPLPHWTGCSPAAGTRLHRGAVGGRIQGGIGLFVELAKHLGQALVELLEHHGAQAGGEIVRTEQPDERGHRHFRPQRIGPLARVAQLGGQLDEALVELGQRVQELVVEQFDDLLAGQVAFQLGFGHQRERALARRLVGGVLPAREFLLDGLAEAGREFQRAVAQGHDRHPVLLHGDVVVPGQARQPHLLLDRAPEAGNHRPQLGDRLMLEGLEHLGRRVRATCPARLHTCRNGTKRHLGDNAKSERRNIIQPERATSL